MGRILQRDILIITVSESNTMGPPLPRVSEFAREVLPPRSPAEGLALEAAHKLAREEGCGAVVVDDLATVRVSGSSVKALCGETLRKQMRAILYSQWVRSLRSEVLSSSSPHVS